jgi:hypothetical protein
MSSAQSVDSFQEIRDTRKFAVTKTSSGYFEVDLGYTDAFEVQIQSYDGQADQKGFCETYPSTISAKSEWTGLIPFEDEEPRSFDNIVYFKGYYILLDSISYSLFVTPDVSEEDAYAVFESNYSNEVDENGEYEDPFMIVGSDDILYIINTDAMFSMDLNALIKATEDEDAPVPEMKKKDPENEGISILNAVHDNNLLYIATSNVVNIYATSSQGIQELITSFDKTFFNQTVVGVVDIVIKGKYAFVLDAFYGLYVVDISTYKTTGKFTYLPKFTQKVQRGKFVEVIGNSISVIVNQKRRPFVNEYIIKGDSEITDIVFNRKTEIYQAVRDTYSDGNFLYLLTGFMNMVLRPGITSKYDTKNITDYLSNYWALYGAKSLVSQTKGQKSFTVAVRETTVSILTFQEASPYISCETSKIPAGLHYYQIHTLQTTCPAKEKDLLGSGDNFDVVCSIEEPILLLVAEDPNSIGNVTRSKQIMLGLCVGIAVFTIIVLMFLHFARKYRNQYRLLEDQIKFQKIEENPISTHETQFKTDAELATQV